VGGGGIFAATVVAADVLRRHLRAQAGAEWLAGGRRRYGALPLRPPDGGRPGGAPPDRYRRPRRNVPASRGPVRTLCAKPRQAGA